jgi:RNA polymerase sigma-70 factor (ECF subfamily)
MNSNPDTRESLILRLPSSQDALAWREFIAIYEPLIIRFAGRRGLQEADAREIAQNVLIAVAKSVDRWQPDRERGRFRAWLFRIARNQLINWISKQATHASSARALDGSALEQFPSEDYRAAEIELEYRREMFRVAAAQARDSFSSSTWDAFWRTAVLAESVDSVAASLSLSPGAVYIARSRVTSKIRDIIVQLEDNNAI